MSGSVSALAVSARDRGQRRVPQGRAGRRRLLHARLPRAPRRRRERAGRLRLGRPLPAQPDRARRRRRGLRPAPAGRRGRAQGAPAAEARALRRQPVPGAQDALVRRRGRRRRDRRDQHVRRPRLRGHRAARRGPQLQDARHVPRGEATGAQPRPVRGGLRRLRHGRRRLRRRRRRARRSTSTRSRSRSSPPARTNDSVRIYTLKREIAEVRRAVLPLREPMRRFADRRRCRWCTRTPRRSSATSPTTSPRPRRSSTPSTACCRRPSTPTWPGSRCSRTTTCARSPPARR